MRLMRVSLACLWLCLLGIGDAQAGHWHGGARVGVVIGPYWGPYFPGPAYYSPYYPPYYPQYYPPYPPIVVERPLPQVYVEQAASPGAEPAATVAPINYWYYCATAKSYYPYVKECPLGWTRVAPQPAGQP